MKENRHFVPKCWTYDHNLDKKPFKITPQDLMEKLKLHGFGDSTISVMGRNSILETMIISSQYRKEKYGLYRSTTVTIHLDKHNIAKSISLEECFSMRDDKITIHYPSEGDIINILHDAKL